MAEKKKNVRYTYNYYDETGKRRTKTFRAPTKAKARLLAQQWEDDNLDNGKPVVSVSEALQRYLDAKRGVLSPSTLRSYEGMQKNHFDDLNNVSIRRLTNDTVQAWVSRLSLSGLSAKTVKNAYGLLGAAVAMQDDGIRLRAQLPQLAKFENYCPSDEDIAALIAQIQRDGDGELLRAVLLAAFGPCRRSEVCALTSNDINGNVVTINKALVKNSDGRWVLKLPKTKDSTRKIVYPQFVIDQCKGIEGPLIQHTPDYIGDKFRKTLKKVNVPCFRFHDLRHYGASIMMYLGISQKTIESRGGWSTNSPVLKRIYQNQIDAEMQKETNKVLEHFSKFSKNLI